MFMIFLRKLIKPFKENAQLRQLSGAQSELDRREWKMQNADIALYDTGIQIQSQRMELYRRINWQIKLQMKRAGYVTNWKWEAELFYGSNSGTTGRGEFLRILWSWNCEQLWIIPRSQSTCEYAESKSFDKPRLLLAACYAEFIGCYRMRFWRHTCSRWTIISIFRNFEEFGIGFLRFGTCGYRKSCGTSWCIGKRNPESCNTDTTFCQEVFDLESSLSCWGNLSSKSDDWMNHRGVKFQNCIFDKFLTLRSSSVRRRISRPKYVLVQEILLTQCCGSKKCMLPHLFFFGSTDSWWSSSTQTQSSHQASQIREYILSDWLRKEMTYKISKQNGTKLY